MRIILILTLALTSTLAAADPATLPDPSVARLFRLPPGAGEETVCFARDYDETHLRRHPGQNVTQTRLLVRIAPSREEAGRSQIGAYFSLRTRGAAKPQIAGYDCGLQADKPGAAHIACIDAGCGYEETAARVEIETPDRARLTLTQDHMKDDNYVDSPDSDPIDVKEDDRVFVLHRAPLEFCEPLAAKRYY